MAVTFQRTIQGTSASATSAAINFSACSAGDAALVMISRASTTNPTAPAGWTLLQSHSSTYGIWLYGKILAAGDLGNVTWTWTGTNARLQISAWVGSGADTDNPFASAKGTFATTTGTVVDGGSLNTQEELLVAFGSAYSTSSKTFTTPAGWTERDDWGSTSSRHWHVIADRTWEGGTATPSFTASANSTYRGGFVVAVKAQAEPTDNIVIERKTTGAWAQVHSGPQDDGEWEDEGPFAGGTTYYYRGKNVSDDDDSEWSDTVQVTFAGEPTYNMHLHNLLMMGD